MINNEESLIIACRDYQEDHIDELLETTNDEKEHIFGYGYEKKRNNTIKLLNKKPNKKNRKKRKISVRALAIAAILMVTAISAVAYGPIKSYMETVHSDWTEIIFNKQNTNDCMEVYPGYIPKGYKLVENSLVKNFSQYMRFENEEGKIIIIDVSLANGMVALNTERNDYKVVDINGYDSFVCNDLGMATIVWSTGEYVYTIDADLTDILTEETVVKIANELERVK